jgi:HK97 family phage major capsid protein
MSELEKLRQEVSELQQAVKAHADDPATIDYGELEKTLKQLLDRMTAKEADRKARRHGETEDVPAVGSRAQREAVKNYAVPDGKYKGVDAFGLWVAKELARKGAMPRSKELNDAIQKADMSTTDAVGGDLVPTMLAGELWDNFFLQSLVVQNLGPMIPMPSNPYEIPIWGEVTWYKGSENTATTATAIATDKPIMTATEIVAEVDWSYTLDEDAIIPMLPNLRSNIQRSGAEKMDAFVLNADATNAGTGNINSDDADPADTEYYLSDGKDGIRHYFLVDDTDQGVDAGGDALTDADIKNALAKMGKYAVRPSDCFMIPDVSTYLKGLMGLDGVQTLDKYGSEAVLLTGELGRYRGIPIVPSESMPLTEADGKASDTAGNNTLGQIAFVNKNLWRVGYRRQLLIEVDRDIQTRQTFLVASFRLAVAARDDGATAGRGDDHTAGIYNISV